MLRKDFVGARKIILRAQQLFPDLENVSQMLTVCNVHCTAELNKAYDFERDWYGILQVVQTADEATIKKQYRKLALLLHPDKNNFAGAEEAFKLIGDAHRVLSDPVKRSVYDVKRKISLRIAAAKQPRPQPNSNPNARTQPAVKTNFADCTIPQQQQQQNQSELPKCPTFWTFCPFCGIRSQFYITLMGRAIRCHICHEPFITKDMYAQGAPPGENSGYTSCHQSGIPQQNENLGQGTHKVGQQPFSKTGTGGESKSKAKKDGDADKRTMFEAKNVSEVTRKAQEMKTSGNEGRKRRRKVVVESSKSCGNTAEEDVVIKEAVHKGRNEGISGNRYPRRSTRHKQNVTYNENLSDNDDIVNPPGSKRSKRDGSSDDADGQSSETFPQGDMREDKHKGSVPVKEELPNGKEHVGKYESNGREQVGVDRENETSNFDANPTENFSVDSSAETKSNVVAFEYPDPEFYDFDKDRKEDKFKAEQIWAIYDDTKEGLPRFYARIRKVFSPFKLRITWLEYDPEDQDEIDSSNMKLPIALGNFKPGGSQYTEDPIFSHLVSWEKGTRDRPYKIYPRKGEIWAIYKDWNVKWCSDPGDRRQRGYEIVEIFSDYAEGSGFSVAYLIKVEHCVFRRQSANNATVLFQIPSHEIFRFSHKIPSYEITGEESKGIPEGSLELDPASLPKEFLNYGDRRVDVDGINAQSVGLCSNSTPEKGKPVSGSKEKPMTPIDLNEKNIREKMNLTTRDCSPRGVGVAYEKKTRQANASKSVSHKIWKESDSRKHGLDRFPDNDKPSEENVMNCQANEKERHLEARKTSPNHCPSPRVSPEAVKEVTNAEFHNFNIDKSQETLRRDQIWALYSDIDDMPKCYARISKIESPDFKVQVRWLEVFSPLANRELPISCGTFKLKDAPSSAYSNTKKFSHRVKAKPNPKKNRYEIYPKEGNVWAVYKNWSSRWTCRDYENCEYEMVEILKSTSSTVKALVLKKVYGFKAVFAARKKGATDVTIEIRLHELQRFSHQVPAFRLTEERGGKLRGYWELDPAAMPAV